MCCSRVVIKGEVVYQRKMEEYLNFNANVSYQSDVPLPILIQMIKILQNVDVIWSGFLVWCSLQYQQQFLCYSAPGPGARLASVLWRSRPGITAAVSALADGGIGGRRPVVWPGTGPPSSSSSTAATVVLFHSNVRRFTLVTFELGVV